MVYKKYAKHVKSRDGERYLAYSLSKCRSLRSTCVVVHSDRSLNNPRTWGNLQLYKTLNLSVFVRMLILVMAIFQSIYRLTNCFQSGR